ncbi:MAG TPA: ABC transporter ATP-binding protein [Anaerolineae bacterium]|nr:MAG: High-affinity branched-chain amino acid transport ATP-binding protein LivF [Chloroflexi bacterium ADurb.Bin222]HOC20646.1 ABC transporter ATP-binding protein [Anaerolineae bacterium]HOS78973.1 ABC transporter ATP-binding protein [Anaerolineae bacterium]HQE99089.1 ABC transporter ATP-binding protein [Anaerolineae bacterium]HQJ10484.1 ABC transporter ATP-binding protein [Anaerolineae bacterium]
MSTLLAIKNLTVAYGAVEALKGVAFEIQEGDVVAVLGANGAGKTTLLKAISGLVPIKTGSITLKGADLSQYPAFRLAGMGIMHIPEGRRVFATLSVEENLNLGAWSVRGKIAPQALQQNLDWVYELFPILRDRKKQLAGTLSGGEQQMLAIGRGLISRPRILLLDEPSLGLAPILVSEIFRVIQKIHEEEGVTILLVEQNARKALGIANYGYILETGKIALHDTAARLRENDHVKAAYLGGGRLQRKDQPA